MKSFLLRLILTAVVILFLGWLLPGVEVSSIWGAVWAALVIAGINALVRPIFVLLTLPVTIVTLGLFLIVINAIVILLADKLVDGFVVNGFWWAVLFSILLSILSSWVQARVLGNQSV